MNLNISPSLRAAVTKQQKERESAGGRKPERDRGKNRCGVLSTLWMRDGLYHLFTTVAWVPQEVKFKSSVNRPGITLTTVWPGWDCTPRHWVSFIYLMPACCMKNVSREGTNSPVPKQKLKFEIFKKKEQAFSPSQTSVWLINSSGCPGWLCLCPLKWLDMLRLKCVF